MKITSSLVFALVVANVFVLAACQDSHNCQGSILCGSLSTASCDAAIRKIISSNRYFVGGPGGACDGHCGVFVSGGSQCDLNGSEMQIAYQELRDRKCAKCGIKTYNDGCLFKIDYVSSCA